MGRLLRRLREWQGTGALLFWLSVWFGFVAILVCVSYFVFFNSKETPAPVAEVTEAKQEEKRTKPSQRVSETDAQLLESARKFVSRAETSLKRASALKDTDEEKSDHIQLNAFVYLAERLQVLEKEAETEETKKEMRAMLATFDKKVNIEVSLPPLENETTGADSSNDNTLVPPP